MEHAMIGAAGELRLLIETAPRHSLPEAGRRLWAAVAAGTITDDEAEQLDGLLRARMTPAADKPQTCRAVRFKPARPHPRESVERRRRWAAAGYLPPRLAHHFTSGETAALAVIASHVAKRGSCDLYHGAVAALAGVSVSTVKRAIRQARLLGLIAVRERRVSRYRSDSNVITICSATWSRWLSLGRRGGGQSWTATSTRDSRKAAQRARESKQGAIGGRSRTGPGQSLAERIRDSGH